MQSLKTLRNDLEKELRNVSGYTFSIFLTQLGSFLVVPLFWRKLSVDDYGILAVAEMVGGFMTFLYGLSLDVALTRFYYEWPLEVRKHRLGALWMLTLTSSVVIGLLSIGILSLISPCIFPSVAFFPYIFLGLIGTILNRFNAIPFTTIRIVNLPRLFFIFSVLTFAVQMGFNIFFVIVLSRGVQGYLVSNIISGAIAFIIGGLIMMRFAIPTFRIHGLESAIKFALYNIPANFISAITSISDRFILQNFASLSTFGIYSICLKFTSLILALHNALKNSYMPYMSKAIADKDQASLNNYVRMRIYYLLPLFFFAVAISLFITDFVHLVNRPSYFPVIDWVPWLVGAVLISTFTVYLAPGLFISKRTDKAWIPAISQLLTIIVLGVFLIPEYEMVGVVLSRYGSVFVFLISHVMLTQFYYPLKTPWGKIGALLLVMAAVIFISRYVKFDNLILNISWNSLLMIGFIVASLILIEGWSSITRILLNLYSNLSPFICGDKQRIQ